MTSRGHIVDVGQMRIHADDQGEGTPALVFLHYWGGSARTWSGVIAKLSGRFRCVAIDLRGWGKSGRDADDYGLDTQANDVAAVITALGLRDFVLVGHSMGGKIAQILAGRRPDGLRGVVLVAPAPPTPLLVPEEQKRTMMESYASAEGIGNALKIISNRPLNAAQRAQVEEDSVGAADAAKRAWISDGMPLDISTQVAAIAVPVCVVAGSADQVEKEDALRKAILPLIPDARFEIIEGAGHLSPLEAPDELAARISAFLVDQRIDAAGHRPQP
ncbi:MAG: putative hydrolase [Bradyrhizobium sp.]|nr:putative hydrolase [Bradyrhizobium sp.]